MSDGEFQELVSQCKIPLLDLDPEEDPLGFNLVQPKYDGWFTIVKITHGIATVITSGGDVRDFFDCTGVDTILLCEWMYGTNWSQDPSRKGKFFVFDILEFNGLDIRNLPYIQRMDHAVTWNALKECSREFSIIPAFALSGSYAMNWKLVWEEYIVNQGFEGLVFKRSKDSFAESKQGRMKKVVSMDYVIMGFKEGTGRLTGTLGSIIGGLWIDGKLEKICTVGGGFSDELRNEIWNSRPQLVGSVFEATGKVLFSSGSLRHPAFSKFCKDKKPQQCVPGVNNGL